VYNTYFSRISILFFNTIQAIVASFTHRLFFRIQSNQEDLILLGAVRHAPVPVKWAEVARSVPDRTGKQCRERYGNHLTPNLSTKKEWSPQEDALLCRMHGLIGTKWTMIARVLPGRTSSKTKTRFLYLQRQFEKQAKSFSESIDSSVAPLPLKTQITAASKHVKPHDGIVPVLAKILAHTLTTGNRLAPPGNNDGSRSSFFGPFWSPSADIDEDAAVCCTRCALMVPSSQTGDAVCAKTGWCVACVETSPYLRDDLLRLQNSLCELATGKRVSLGHD